MEMKAPFLTIKVKTIFFSYLLLVLLNISNVNAQSKPTIDSFEPYTAEVGSTVTLYGNNFNSNPNENIVYFGSVRANVISSDTNSITVIVPPSSTYAPITVTNSGLTAVSKNSFGVRNSSISNETVTNSSFLNPVNYSSTIGTNTIIGDCSTSIAIDVADFDLDGKPDIVKGGKNSNITVHLNTNSVVGTIDSGTFASGIDFVTAGESWSIVTADFDGDRKKDIASVSTNNISILRNSSNMAGTVNFDSAVNISTVLTSNIQAADINDDGKIDIIVSNGNSNNFKVYLNQSSVGTISFSNSGIQFGGAYSSRNITVGDINMDGKPDVLLFGEKLYLYINNSTTTNVSFQEIVTLSSSEYFGSLIDIDGDGDNDIVGNHSIIQNNIIETINSQSFNKVTYFEYEGYSKNTVGDFNGDGKTDFVLEFNKDSNNKIFYIKNNNSEGNFSTSLLTQFSNSNTIIGTPILCDVDGDNKLDLISSEGGSPIFKVLKNNIGQEPIIQTTGTLSTFYRCTNQNSPTQSIVVSGIRLLNDITIYIPQGFEASLNTTDWSNSPIVLSRTGDEVLPTEVYFRGSRLFSGNINGTITLSSTNALTVNYNCGAIENYIAPPTVINTTNYCQNSVATELQVNLTSGNTIRWYDSSPEQVLLVSAPIPNTTELGTSTYFVSQVNDATGCESEKVAININVYPVPFSEEITPSNITLCKNSIQMLSTGNANAIWSPTTGLYLDELATLSYDGSSVATVYAKISVSSNYIATFSNGTSCTVTSSCQLNIIESIGGVAIGGGSYPVNSPDLNLSVEGYEGSIVRWEKSVSPYTVWSAITNSASPTYAPGLFSVNTKYRAVVKNGLCSISYSSPAIVLIDNSINNYYTTIGTSFWNATVTPLTSITINSLTLPVGNLITSYKVEVTNTYFNTVTEYQSTLPKFRIIDLPSSVANYNNSFSVRVSLQINGVWQPYGTAKIVNTSTIIAPSISSAFCGQTLTSINKSIVCTKITLATSYVFEINYVVNGATLETITFTSTTNSFNLVNLPFNTFPVKYNSTYSVRVKAKYSSNGVEFESNYGNFCTITTPNTAPVASITSGCGFVPNNITSIKCTAFTSVTLYKFELTDGIEVFQIITPLNKFTLSMIAGIAPNTNYTVTPSVKIYGQFYEGLSCEITTPNVAAKQSVDNEIKDVETNFKVTAYPNPFSNSFRFNLSDSKSDSVEIKVYDLLSNLLENRTLSNSELEYLEFGENYPTGIYTVIITQDGSNQVSRIIKK